MVTLTGRRFIALMLALLMFCACIPAAVAEETDIYGCVTGDKVKFRQYASKSAGYWEMLPQGWVMTILGTSKVQGDLWYHVKGELTDPSKGTKTGYILGEYFRPLTLEETAIWLNNPTQGTIAGKPLEEALEAEEPAPVVTAAGGWVMTAVSGVSLRPEPVSSSDSLAVLPQGAMLQVSAYTDGWYYVDYNGENGYVSSAYVRTATAAEISAFMNGTQTAEAEESDALNAKLSAAQAQANAADAVKAVVYTPDGETISLRVSRSKSARVITYLPNGTDVTVLEVDGDWATVIYDLTIGYVLKDCLIFSAVPAGAAGRLIGTDMMATVNVGSGTLPLLKEPSDDSDSLKSIPNRAELFILEARSEWSKTIYAGKTGYVDTQLLTFATAGSGYAPYAVITSQKSVNVRANAKKNAKVVDHAAAGAVLPLWASPWTNDGYTWYPVTVNDVDAYIRGDTCRLLTAQEYNQGGSGEQEPETEPAEELSDFFESLSSALNIRAAATTSSKSLGKLRKHDRMRFIGTTTVKDELWYKVNYKGTPAFVMGKYIRVLTKAEAGEDSTATPAPTAAPTAAPAGLSDVAYTLKNNTYIRKENTINSTSLTKIRSRGSFMTWLGDMLPDKNGGNYTWYHVQYLNTTGWIRGDLIHVMTYAEWEKEFGPVMPTAAPTAVVPTAAPTATPANGGTLTDVAYTIKSNVFVRKENTMNSTSVTKIFKVRSYMTLLGEVKADKNGEKYTWYRVNYNNKTGWVRGDLIHIITNQEWEEDFATPVPVETATPKPAVTPAPSWDDSDLGPYVAYDILRYGSTGLAVTQMQQALYEQGYLSPNNVIGTFNDATRQAIRTFQQDNGLTADGVAGQLTLAALFRTKAYDTTLYPVEKATWAVANKAWPRGSVAMVTDVTTGLSFAAKRYAGGNHADVEPLTAADTAIMCRIYGVENSQEINELNLYQRRPIWVTINGRSLAASMYGVPHNPGGDTLPDNDFTGQFCVHFVGSKTHNTDIVDPDHQAAINIAYNSAPVKK